MKLVNNTLYNVSIVDICNGIFIIPQDTEIIGQDAFYNSRLKAIAIPDTVTAMQCGSFCGCSDLESISVPNSHEEIPENAFHQCYKLKNFCFPKNLKSIGKSAFGYCSSLEKIDFPFSLVTISEWSFAQCVKLKLISIPKNVRHIYSSAFSGCIDLEQVDILFSLDNLGDYAFRGCKSLKKITLPKEIKFLGTDIFSACPNIERIIINSCDESEVAQIRLRLGSEVATKVMSITLSNTIDNIINEFYKAISNRPQTNPLHRFFNRPIGKDSLSPSMPNDILCYMNETSFNHHSFLNKAKQIVSQIPIPYTLQETYDFKIKLQNIVKSIIEVTTATNPREPDADFVNPSNCRF